MRLFRMRYNFLYDRTEMTAKVKYTYDVSKVKKERIKWENEASHNRFYSDDVTEDVI